MWKKRDMLRVGAAIAVTLAAWGVIRLLFPTLDYFPPERLTTTLDPSWFVSARVRKAAMVVYAAVALVLMAVFFKAIQERWPGRGGAKGFAFGASLGAVWSFGFLTGWAFLGTTLRAELLNSVVDLVGLAVAGWLVGLAVGRDVPKSERKMWKPWLAVLLIAFGFVAVHGLGTALLVDFVTATGDLLLVPTTLPQIALLSGLGVWVGIMYVALREGLPCEGTWARVALFAFGVFGHSWTWFHLFFVIEFAGVVNTVLLVGVIGAVGVFAGALGYEGLASGRQRPIKGSE